MHSLFIFTDVHEITVESEEVLLIKQENEMLRKRQEKLDDISRRLDLLEKSS